MAKSRSELVAWVNDLLSLNYTKVEQMGSGDAYVQIIDSIYGDVPMHRVKFGTKHEYEYVVNFKVLQNAFKAHKIEKPIPIDSLTKCKMQDNLEFLQWLRLFWDQNFPGGDYDAAARRGFNNGPATNAAANRSATASARRPMNDEAANRSMSSRGANTSLRANPDHSIVLNLQKELQEERTTVAALEKERDFYFGKLRDVELLIQREQDVNPEIADDLLMKDIQAILYNTEDGFEVPQDEQVVEEAYPDETF